MKHFTIFKSWLAMLLLLVGVSTSWAETFSSKESLTNLWTSSTTVGSYSSGTTGYDGVQFGSKNTPASEFTLTSINAYTNVESVTIKASTGGVASIASVKVGAVTLTAPAETTIPAGVANKNTEFVFTANGSASGTVVITFNATSKAMYVGAIDVLEKGGTVTPTDPDPETPVVETYAYTLEVVGQGSVVFKDANGTVVAAGQKVAKGTKVTPTFTPATGWELSKWEYLSSTGEWKTLTDQFSITKDVKFKVTFTEVPSTPIVDVIPNFIKTATLTLTAGDEAYDVRKCLNIPSDVDYDKYAITTSIDGQTSKEDEFACVYPWLSFKKAGTYTVTVKAPAVDGKYAETTGTITVTVKDESTEPETPAEIAEMSIADFIAAGGSTEGVYLIGTVGKIDNATFGNFDLTDESGTIYIYGCLTPEGQKQQFATLGVAEGDKIKVLAKEYKLFNSTKEAVNVVFVEKISGSTVVTYDITIAETENGTLKAPASASAGSEVSITVTPTSGYKLDVLTVTDAKGNAVELNGNKFIMPESAVTVSATFKPVDIIDFGEHSFVPNQVEMTENKEAFSLTGTANGYTVVAKKGESSTSTPAYNATAQDMRVYAKGTLTITSDEPFNEVVFAISEQGLKRQAPITADCGEVAAQTAGDKTVTWTSEEGVTSVTFTVGEKADYGSDGAAKAGQLCFNYIDITAAALATSGTIKFTAKDENGRYWATFSSDRDVVFIDRCGAVPFTVTLNGTKVVTHKIPNDSRVDYVGEGFSYYGMVVPAGTGVLVGGGYEPTEVTYFYPTKIIEFEPFNYSDNLLRPASEAMTGDCKFYRLAYDDYSAKTGLGFYYGAADGAAFSCKAGSAYLAVPASQAVKGFKLMSDEDAIKSVEMAEQDAIYDLQGRKVSKAQKGLYIVNGKKVVR